MPGGEAVDWPACPINDVNGEIGQNRMKFNMQKLAKRLFDNRIKTSADTVGITREVFGQGKDKALEVVKA